MRYQREKNHRLYKQGLLVAENARLTIVKQVELVECFCTISKILSMELKVSNDHDIPHTSRVPTTTMMDPGNSDTIKLKKEARTALAIPMDTTDVMKPVIVTSTNSDVIASTSQAMLYCDIAQAEASSVALPFRFSYILQRHGSC
jgi:hypothetical protein